MSRITPSRRRSGYKRLCKKLREESIGEMRRADRLIERTLYLDGILNGQRLGMVNVGRWPSSCGRIWSRSAPRSPR